MSYDFSPDQTSNTGYGSYPFSSNNSDTYNTPSRQNSQSMLQIPTDQISSPIAKVGEAALLLGLGIELEALAALSLSDGADSQGTGNTPNSGLGTLINFPNLFSQSSQPKTTPMSSLQDSLDQLLAMGLDADDSQGADDSDDADEAEYADAAHPADDPDDTEATPVTTPQNSTSNLPIRTTVGTPSLASNFGNGGTQTQDGFDISSWGDPHLTASINGGPSSTEKVMSNIPDLLTMATSDGDTQIGTQETAVDSKGVTYNKAVDIQHNSGDSADDWDLSTTDNNGQMQAVLTNSSGTTTLASGQSLTEADGSVITNQGSKISVTQGSPSNGGTETTSIIDNGHGLDVDASGTGKDLISGAGADFAAKSTPSAT